MSRADTPMPGEDPGTLIEDEDRLDEIEPGPRDGEGDPQPAPRGGETPGRDAERPQRT